MEVLYFLFILIASIIVYRYFNKKNGKRKEEEDICEIIPDFLYLSNMIPPKNLDLLKSLKITSVLTITGSPHSHFSEIEYLHLKLYDKSDSNIRGLFQTAHTFIEEVKAKGGRILVHCEGGISRSPTVVMSYLMKTNKWSLSKSFYHVKNKRPIICPNFGFMSQLSKFEKELEINSNTSEFLAEFCMMCTPGMEKQGISKEVLIEALLENENDIHKALDKIVKEMNE